MWNLRKGTLPVPHLIQREIGCLSWYPLRRSCLEQLPTWFFSIYANELTSCLSCTVLSVFHYCLSCSPFPYPATVAQEFHCVPQHTWQLHLKLYRYTGKDRRLEESDRQQQVGRRSEIKREWKSWESESRKDTGKEWKMYGQWQNKR